MLHSAVASSLLPPFLLVVAAFLLSPCLLIAQTVTKEPVLRCIGAVDME
jgi:hypothetical protein